MYTIKAIHPKNLLSVSLRNQRKGACEAAIVTVDGCVEMMEALHLPVMGRVGLSWGSEADWTDSDSIQEAVETALRGL
jgi:hypothetical protein